MYNGAFSFIPRNWYEIFHSYKESKEKVVYLTKKTRILQIFAKICDDFQISAKIPRNMILIFLLLNMERNDYHRQAATTPLSLTLTGHPTPTPGSGGIFFR